MPFSTAQADHLFLAPPPRSAFFLGLDLGQSQDHSALVVVERLARTFTQSDGVVVTGYQRRFEWRIRHAERIALGVSYRHVQRRVAQVVQALGPAATLVVDASGVGAPVFEALRAELPAAHVVGVVITGAGRPSRNAGRWTAPRGELVGVLRLLIEKGELRAARGMTGFPQLLEELQSFTEHAAHAVHDDLVMALALACWWAHRGV